MPPGFATSSEVPSIVNNAETNNAETWAALLLRDATALVPTDKAPSDIHPLMRLCSLSSTPTWSKPWTEDAVTLSVKYNESVYQKPEQQILFSS